MLFAALVLIGVSTATAAAQSAQTAAHLVLKNSKLCLEVENAEFTNGARLLLAACKEEGSNGHQRWEYNAAGQIVSLFSGKCLDAVLSTGATADVQLWDCLGGDSPPRNQAWDFSAEGLISSRFDTRCLQVHGSAKSGSSIMMFACAGADQLQQFEIRDGVVSTGVTRTAGGCTCSHMWSMNGKTFVYPNNCANPSKKEKSEWCFTDASENCVGSSGTVHWDYCSSSAADGGSGGGSSSSSGAPTTKAAAANTASSSSSSPKRGIGVTTQLRGATNEHAVGVASLPQAGSGAGGGTPSVIGRVRPVATTQMAAATNSSSSSSSNSSSNSWGPNVIRRSSEEIHMSAARTTPCVHGRMGGFATSGGGLGKCACNDGFAGEFCDDCSPDHFNYPVCERKLMCNSHLGPGNGGCKGGTCDFSSGVCICPFNRIGDHCIDCAPGFGGDQCTPGGGTGGAGLFGSMIFYSGLVLAVAAFVVAVAKEHGLIRL